MIFRANDVVDTLHLELSNTEIRDLIEDRDCSAIVMEGTMCHGIQVSA